MSENLSGRPLRLRVCKRWVFISTLFLLLGMGRASSAAAESEALAKPMRVNRTVPQVAPPKTGLEFSASPTTHEISRARVFEEPLVPIGREPTAEENAALAAALLGYAKRNGPDDFASLTDFLERHPDSPWRAALLTGLGLEYYNTAYYSRALEAWQGAWALGRKAIDAQGKFIADRAVCELAGLYSRLGRMIELEALLRSIEQRTFLGGASERINIAREVLASMKQRPEISFRCGPLALQSIKRSLDPQAPVLPDIFNSASTPQGFSLSQVAELSKKVGLNYQMAFRGPLTRSSTTLSPSDGERDGVRGAFVVPSVVHWKVGHYAALVRQEGDKFLLEDPTFATTVWATRQALEAETSGYFLVSPGDLPRGWRGVDIKEGESVWGKGTPALSDGNQYACGNEQTGACGPQGCAGMAVSSVHLMLANLQIRDTPVGYAPPVGPAVRFTVRYNQRDILQPPSEATKLLGPKWTHDWNESLQTSGADMKYIVGGGGARVFTGFNPTTQTYAPNEYDQTLLKRTSATTFEMTWPDGSRKIFGPLSDPSGFLLAQVLDPAGNAVTLTYDGSLRLVALTDAIGQVTTLFYNHPTNPNLITKVTDPFGRFASFEYDAVGVPTGGPNPGCTNTPAYVDMDFLVKITDVLGLQSQFNYKMSGSALTNHACMDEPAITLFTQDIASITTPYGTTSFTTGGGTNANNTLFRFVKTRYPDGSSDRVEYNQSDTLGVPNSDPVASIPVGASAHNLVLYGRNTFYWSRTAEASSQGDHTKAKIFHWLHTADITSTAGILSSTKEPLEGRVWYDYPGGGGFAVGSSARPAHIGRVLDDGQTQLYTMAYNSFGNLTSSIDPLGRTFSYFYASNGIDLLEVRQTRAANNELLFRATYDAQHRPLTSVDTSGQTNRFIYNARGQVRTNINAKGETTTYTYTADGYLLNVDGPLAGTNDVVRATYDTLGHVRTMTSVSGYTLTFDYDDMDRVTKITYPDATFEQYTFDRLDLASVLDRAGQQTSFEYDPMRQLKKQTDPLGRVTRFDWCRCGQIKSLTDPLGRTTTWLTDVQGRNIAKQYADGSQVTYQYENTISRLRLAIDEKQQVTQFQWNRDDALKSFTYANAVLSTPGVSFQYDPDYARVVSISDGTGTTRYSYNPITGTPALGAGALAGVDGPLPNDTVTYLHDELNRPVHRAINGVGEKVTFDEAGRPVGITNALGAFVYGYDGSTSRLLTESFPNGQTVERAYGNNVQNRTLQRITHKFGVTPISEFLYGHDVTRGRIATWSQQAGTQTPNLFTLGYDSINQLLTASVTNTGNLINTFAYAYDLAGNRLAEQVDASNHVATYNGLNEIRTTTAPGITHTNEWDAQDRLVAVNAGNQRTEFTYDGLSRRVAIRHLLNGAEVSLRRFVWSGGEICEERDAAGAVTKRFFPQGVRVESGAAAGAYFYTRDHLGSIRELTDASGNLRARYTYDPYGRQTKLAGDLDADFGFAGMLWCPEARLSLTHFRAYDPGLGRWLSRDPLDVAEMKQGPNLYAYVFNDPINQTDPSGLFSTLLKCFTPAGFIPCAAAGLVMAQNFGQRVANTAQNVGQRAWQGVQRCGSAIGNFFSRTPQLPPAAPPPTQVVNVAETFFTPQTQGRFQAILERIPEARRQWQAFTQSLRQNPDFPDTDRWLRVGYGETVSFGSPQIIADLEASVLELSRLSGHSPQFIKNLLDFNFLGW